MTSLFLSATSSPPFVYILPPPRHHHHRIHFSLPLISPTMQEALPYKTWQLPIPRGTGPPCNHSLLPGATSIAKMVSENAVIVFGRRGCCMTHVVNRLLLGLGVNPAVCEVDEHDEINVLDELGAVAAGLGKQGLAVQFPAVFIGGKLFGGLDRVMATHITGELVPILKQAGALWL